MRIEFQDKTVVVTGGGTGIGQAISMAFADSGAQVAIVYRHSQREAEQTVLSIEANGGRAIAVKADVTQWEQVCALFEQVDDVFKGVDVLVNNAGGNIEKCTLDQMSQDIWRQTMDLNLNSVFLCCKAAIRRLPNRQGRIINITSMSGHTGGGKGGVAYGAAKAGVTALTRGLAHELAPRGITVNAIAPGVINTRQHQLFTSPEDYQAFINKIPLGRHGQPQDIAGITLLLASPQGGFVTGQTIHVNGGMLMV